MLCPSREPHNDSLAILQSKPFSRFDEVHVVLLRYKWDLHAELRIGEIQNYLTLPNVTIFPVLANPSQRQSQIISYLKSLYP